MNVRILKNILCHSNIHVFIVAEDGDQLVLFQYLDPDNIAPAIDSDIYEDLCIEYGIYIHEVGRTTDIDVMKRTLYAMAYRYTKNDLYIFPVSLYVATETSDLKKQEERRINGQVKN